MSCTRRVPVRLPSRSQERTLRPIVRQSRRDIPRQIGRTQNPPILQEDIRRVHGIRTGERGRLRQDTQMSPEIPDEGLQRERDFPRHSETYLAVSRILPRESVRFLMNDHNIMERHHRLRSKEPRQDNPRKPGLIHGTPRRHGIQNGLLRLPRPQWVRRTADDLRGLSTTGEDTESIHGTQGILRERKEVSDKQTNPITIYQHEITGYVQNETMKLVHR